MLKSIYLQQVYSDLAARDPEQKEFHQAVREVLESLDLMIDSHPEYREAALLERFVEPERVVAFRVPWMDDTGRIRVNRGYRVQFNSAIGPYKGGLRFHPSVNLSILKFLGFEQILKNSLTGLPMGQFVDVPAGDIGVGGREIGYLFGQYKRIRDSFDGGVLTGKGLSFGGSLTRNEATGYGLCYLTEEMLHCMKQESLQGKRVAISGSGNVAIFACQKAQELGARVITMSDSNGCIYDPEGIRLDVVKDIKLRRRGRIREYTQLVPGSEFRSDFRDLWSVPCDVALPCATQNEIDAETARRIVRGGAMALAEGANMPSTPAAIEVLREGGVLFAPAKAANAGGVAVSGLEMCQNSMRLAWTFDEVDQRLHQIMLDIFHNIYDASVEYGVPGNLLDGANIAGFRKVADAMLAQGVC